MGNYISVFALGLAHRAVGRVVRTIFFAVTLSSSREDLGTKWHHSYPWDCSTVFAIHLAMSWLWLLLALRLQARFEADIG